MRLLYVAVLGWVCCFLHPTFFLSWRIVSHFARARASNHGLRSYLFYIPSFFSSFVWLVWNSSLNFIFLHNFEAVHCLLESSVALKSKSDSHYFVGNDFSFWKLMESSVFSVMQFNANLGFLKISTLKVLSFWKFLSPFSLGKFSFIII